MFVREFMLMTVFAVASCQSLTMVGENRRLYLSAVRSRGGEMKNVLFSYNLEDQSRSPVCFHDQAKTDQTLLLHQLCGSYGYQSLSYFQFLDLSEFGEMRWPEQGVGIGCSQNSHDFTIRCKTFQSQQNCSAVLQVECGSCHSEIHIGTNTTKTIRSPLYPVLQPNTICIYDIIQESKVGVFVDDLSLNGPTFSLKSNSDNCMTSFLHILSGSDIKHLTSVATLCGELTGAEEFQSAERVLRLVLVTGPFTHNLRGFSIRISPSVVDVKQKSKVYTFLVVFFSVLLGISGLLFLVAYLVGRRMKRKACRRRSTAPSWTGAARPSTERQQAVNQAQTTWLRRAAQENLYNLDTRVPLPASAQFARQQSADSQELSHTSNRPLPDLPYSEEDGFTNSDVDSSDVIYESFNSAVAGLDLKLKIPSEASQTLSISVESICSEDTSQPDVPARPTHTLEVVTTSSPEYVIPPRKVAIEKLSPTRIVEPDAEDNPVVNNVWEKDPSYLELDFGSGNPQSLAAVRSSCHGLENTGRPHKRSKGEAGTSIGGVPPIASIPRQSRIARRHLSVDIHSQAGYTSFSQIQCESTPKQTVRNKLFPGRRTLRYGSCDRIGERPLLPRNDEEEEGEVDTNGNLVSKQPRQIAQTSTEAAEVSGAGVEACGDSVRRSSASRLGGRRFSSYNGRLASVLSSIAIVFETAPGGGDSGSLVNSSDDDVF